MIVGLGLFQFKEDSSDRAMNLLLEHMEEEKKSNVILRGYVARSMDSPAFILIYTEWESEERRREMYKRLRETKGMEQRFSEIIKIVEGEPLFSTFEVMD
jgi:quinol monooxygenase YgiN